MDYASNEPFVYKKLMFWSTFGVHYGLVINEILDTTNKIYRNTETLMMSVVSVVHGTSEHIFESAATDTWLNVSYRPVQTPPSYPP